MTQDSLISAPPQSPICIEPLTVEGGTQRFWEASFSLAHTSSLTLVSPCGPGWAEAEDQKAPELIPGAPSSTAGPPAPLGPGSTSHSPREALLASQQPRPHTHPSRRSRPFTGTFLPLNFTWPVPLPQRLTLLHGRGPAAPQDPVVPGTASSWGPATRGPSPPPSTGGARGQNAEVDLAHAEEGPGTTASVQSPMFWASEELKTT